MRRFNTLFVVALCSLFLAACGNLGSSSGTSGTTTSKGTQLTGQAASGDYQSVIKNGRYVTSKSRGVNVSQNDNQYNLKSFESGLLTVSKKVYSPSKYIFEEGQYLSTNTVQNWLARKSKSNPTGLNPVNNGKTGANTRNPIYLQQMEEQDYMKQNGKKLTLSGVTIGLGLNSIDYYQKQNYGATYETHISNATIQREGRQIANQVLARLRKKAALRNVPITIALYKQASDDSLVGGNFFSYSVNRGSSTSVGSWKAISEKNYVYPTTSSSSSTGNSNDESSFENFKTQIQNYFPNLSGVTAQAHYVDHQLSGMNVSITTQFYSETEIISFTQYLQQAAQKYLPSGAPIDITVKSAEGVQSFLSRDQGEKKFTSHVFDSY
ncbi:CamS family sex pheromone protein [Secundilactobacillus folii]|uniref:CamS family sex pheromone protein n=1 Tax=Secundilactobacillus folii TaxID=2678357 RepID=A0A7X2XW25_9LACO|nr:CamS family sex pheromone protein [Secundilactobacillus folii]MTV81958.1 CamS family sex pheromone protein [Secundilactobacillus folii]